MPHTALSFMVNMHDAYMLLYCIQDLSPIDSGPSDVYDIRKCR